MSKVFATKPFDWEPHPLATRPATFEPRTGPVLKHIEIDDPMHTDNVNRALLEGADLSDAEMFAMMNMSDDYRHKAIWHHARLNIFVIPPFTFGTFIALRERDYAFQPEGSRFHRLAQSALPLANAVADDLVTRHKIHAPILVHTYGEISKHVSFSMPAGTPRPLTPNAGGQESRSSPQATAARSILRKRSIVRDRKRTSITVADEDWTAFKVLASERKCRLDEIVFEIDRKREGKSLSSSVRSYIEARRAAKEATLVPDNWQDAGSQAYGDGE